MFVAATPHCWDVAAGAQEGGPDYRAVVPPPEYQPAAIAPEFIEVDGEPVLAALDVPVWLALADCEWRAGWHERTSGNRFYGRFQWVLSTWRSLAATSGFAFPDEAPIGVQLDAARENLDRSGWGQWPGCARRLGYR
jgi:hypothetical protein